MAGLLSRVPTWASGKTYVNDKPVDPPLSGSTLRDEDPPLSGLSGSTLHDNYEEKADWKDIVSAGIALLLLFMATGLLGYTVFKGKEIILAKGTMSWSLKGAADTLKNVADEGKEFADNVAKGGEDAVDTLANGVQDLLPRGLELDSSDTWKFSLTLNKLALDEADDWPKTIKDR